jgi:hypothetical protein
MRIGRTALIPIILALGVAGSVLSGSEVSAVIVHTTSVHVQQATAPSTLPDMKLHG